jgi:N6-L-threonylcarbamoyladenine synthase
MKILAIESSCDETAAAVVEDGRNVLSNIVASQVEEHKLYGGVVPEIASRRHAEAIVGVVDEALSAAGCTLDDIDAVAVTYAPGLIGALLVGVNFAKGLSLAADKPLIPVHHLRSHIASNYISHKELFQKFKHLLLLKSDENAASQLRLRNDIHLENLCKEEERLRAYYYAEESDTYTLFTPYIPLQENELKQFIKTL